MILNKLLITLPAVHRMLIRDEKFLQKINEFIMVEIEVSFYFLH